MHVCSFLLALTVTFPGQMEAPQAPEVPAVAADPAVQRVYDALLPALSIVRITVLDDPEAPYRDRAPIQDLYDNHSRLRLPMSVAGVRVTPEGTLLIRDSGLPLKRYGPIEAWDASGQSKPMKVSAVLENHAGVLLEPAVSTDARLPCISFAPAQLRKAEPLWVAQPAFLEDTLALRVDAAATAAIAAGVKDDAVEMVWWQDRHAPDPLSAVPVLLFNGQGEAVGMVLDEAAWRSDKELNSWVGLSILEDRRLDTAALEATWMRLRAGCEGSLKEVEVFFRSDSRAGQYLSAGEGRYVLYGLLLDAGGRIFVPTELDRDAIRQIDRIVVREGERIVEAQFEGLFRDYGAFLIRAKGVAGTPAVLPASVSFPRGRIFHTLSVARRYGQRQVETDYNRYLDVAKGYKDTRILSPRKPLDVGALIFDAEGRLAGFYAPIRREERDEILARQARRQQPQGHQRRIFLFPEIAADLAGPKGRFDPVARPMSRQEEQGLCWLGVEFQPMTPAVARAMNAEGPTRNGARGLLVTGVYDPSPAARMGLRRGDILLTLTFPGAPGEIDLAQPPRAGEGGRGPGIGGYRIWRPRRNYFTAILTLLGEGRPATLRLFSGGVERRLDFQIEKAPQDFDSAPQHEDSALGLTVRPMTYDVRDVLRLPSDAPGVVVSDVVAGSKAAVAQIRPYEIISQVDGRKVSGLKDFEDALRAAAARQRVELLVFLLGQSRIVEIDLAHD